MKSAGESCEIVNELGLHLRAAAAFVKLAEKFESAVALERDGASADGKSILSLVTLAAPKGSRVRVTADGPDAASAVRELAKLIRGRFGEER